MLVCPSSPCPKRGWMLLPQLSITTRRTSTGRKAGTLKVLTETRRKTWATDDVQRPAQGAGSVLWFEPLLLKQSVVHN